MLVPVFDQRFFAHHFSAIVWAKSVKCVDGFQFYLTEVWFVGTVDSEHERPVRSLFFSKARLDPKVGLFRFYCKLWLFRAVLLFEAKFSRWINEDEQSICGFRKLDPLNLYRILAIVDDLEAVARFRMIWNWHFVTERGFEFSAHYCSLFARDRQRLPKIMNCNSGGGGGYPTAECAHPFPEVGLVVRKCCSEGKAKESASTAQPKNVAPNPIDFLHSVALRSNCNLTRSAVVDKGRAA